MVQPFKRRDKAASIDQRLYSRQAATAFSVGKLRPYPIALPPIREERSKYILHVAVSSDGKHLAAARGDHSVIIVRIADRPEPESSGASAPASVSTSSSLLLSSSSMSTASFNLRPASTTATATAPPIAVAVAPPAQLVRPRPLRPQDAPSTGERARKPRSLTFGHTSVLTGHPRTVVSAAFHPADSNLLATVCRGGKVILWRKSPRRSESPETPAPLQPSRDATRSEDGAWAQIAAADVGLGGAHDDAGDDDDGNGDGNAGGGGAAAVEALHMFGAARNPSQLRFVGSESWELLITRGRDVLSWPVDDLSAGAPAVKFTLPHPALAILPMLGRAWIFAVAAESAERSHKAHCQRASILSLLAPEAQRGAAARRAPAAVVQQQTVLAEAIAAQTPDSLCAVDGKLYCLRIPSASFSSRAFPAEESSGSALDQHEATRLVLRSRAGQNLLGGHHSLGSDPSLGLSLVGSARPMADRRSTVARAGTLLISDDDDDDDDDDGDANIRHGGFNVAARDAHRNAGSHDDPLKKVKGPADQREGLDPFDASLATRSSAIAPASILRRDSALKNEASSLRSNEEHAWASERQPLQGSVSFLLMDRGDRTDPHPLLDAAAPGLGLADGGSRSASDAGEFNLLAAEREAQRWIASAASASGAAPRAGASSPSPAKRREPPPLQRPPPTRHRGRLGPSLVVLDLADGQVLASCPVQHPQLVSCIRACEGGAAIAVAYGHAWSRMSRLRSLRSNYASPVLLLYSHYRGTLSLAREIRWTNAVVNSLAFLPGLGASLVAGSSSGEVVSFRPWGLHLSRPEAATLIQSAVRGWLVRKKIAELEQLDLEGEDRFYEPTQLALSSDSE